MTRLARPEPGDRQRADRILDEARRALRPYRDPAAAVGYLPFPPNPGPDLPVTHYVNPQINEGDGVDHSRPGSILCGTPRASSSCWARCTRRPSRPTSPSSTAASRCR